MAFSHNAVTTEDGNLFWVDEEGGVKNKYTYNGKEFLDDLGINLHYYGYRMYDPAIARFTSVDPIAEDFAFVSGFNYAENEPIANIDLHGLQRANMTRGRVRPSPNYGRNRRNFAQARTNAQRDGMRTQRMNINQSSIAGRIRSKALESINPLSNTFNRFPSISSVGNDSRTQNFERIYKVVDHTVKFTKKVLKSTSIDLIGDSENPIVREMGTNYSPVNEDLASQLNGAEQAYQTEFGALQQSYAEGGLSDGMAFVRAYSDLGASPQDVFNNYARQLENQNAVAKEKEKTTMYPTISPQR